MTVPLLELRKAVFSMEEPWKEPAGATRFEMIDSSDGSSPTLPTSGFAFYDESMLYLLFRGRDEGEAVATYTLHDEPLYEEDVFEAFLAPRSLSDYFEIEVNPLGATFDARVHSPLGSRASMEVDRSWDCKGLQTAVRSILRSEGRCLEALMAIPFQDLRVSRPESGETWRANFYRIDRDASHGDSYSAWSPTLKTPPDFHVPSRFGELRFL